MDKKSTTNGKNWFGAAVGLSVAMAIALSAAFGDYTIGIPVGLVLGIGLSTAGRGSDNC